MKNVISQAQLYIAPIIESLGYEVVDIEYKSLYNKMNLTFYIHKPEGITIADCEKVNNEIDAPLEEYDITNGRPYILNISSPGLDRPIRTDKDLERNINTNVDITFINPIKKKRKSIGKLIAFDDENIELMVKEKSVKIDRDNIKIIVPHIKF